MNKKTKALNRKNNELDHQISAENNEAMTDLVCYLRGANISEYNQEVVRQDLLSMVLAAQSRGEDIKTVIGEDYQSFCDEVIAALPPRSLFERVLSYIDLLCLCVAILSVINIVLSKDTFTLIGHVFTGKSLNFQLSISFSTLIFYVLIIGAAIAIVQVICKTSLKKKKTSPQSKPKRFLIGGAIGAGVMGMFLTIAWLGRETLLTVNIFAACIFTLVIYLIHLLLREYV